MLQRLLLLQHSSSEVLCGGNGTACLCECQLVAVAHSSSVLVTESGDACWWFLHSSVSTTGSRNLLCLVAAAALEFLMPGSSLGSVQWHGLQSAVVFVVDA